MHISIVLPCFNEAENIRAVIDDVSGWFDSIQASGEIIAVDDGSTDETGGILDQIKTGEARLKVVHHSANKGHGTALLSGFALSHGDVMGMMDADGQLKAGDFSRLLAGLSSHDVAIGRRTRRSDPLSRLIFMKAYAVLVRFILGISSGDVNCGMKLWKRNIWETIKPRVATGGLFHAELLARCTKNCIAWQTIPVSHFPRTGGKQTGASLKVIRTILIELIKLKAGLRRKG